LTLSLVALKLARELTPVTPGEGDVWWAAYYLEQLPMEALCESVTKDMM